MHAVLIALRQLHSFGQRAVVASALWSPRSSLHSESSGFGLLLGCLGVGSILAALMIGRLRQMLSPDTIVTGGMALFGAASTLALAYLSSFGAVARVLLAGGMAWMSVNSTLNTAAQTSLPAWVRARGWAVYLLVFQGAMAVGSVIWGAIANRLGLRTTLFIAGITLLAAAAGHLADAAGRPRRIGYPAVHALAGTYAACRAPARSWPGAGDGRIFDRPEHARRVHRSHASRKTAPQARRRDPVGLIRGCRLRPAAISKHS